jgi:hypothetical protein
MPFSDVYGIGRSLPILGWNNRKMQKKLSFMLFPYSAREVIATSVALLLCGTGAAGAMLLFGAFLASASFLAYAIFFLALVASVVTYIYPAGIFYNREIGEYNEEMLRATLRMTTFISMDTSIEYAFVETSSRLHGTLRLQFESIKNEITRKQKMTLGDAIEPYIPVWNEINPVFVKSLRLLQTAALAPMEDRDKILSETVETMLLNYSTIGKRYAEELSRNSQKLIMVGILIPIMSLMLLPLLSIFLPELVQPSVLAFIYIILFPTMTLLMALNFGAKRVQVDTVHIEDAQEYRPMPPYTKWLGIGLAVAFALPSLYFISSIKPGDPVGETSLALLLGWLISFGMVIGVYIYAAMHTRRYKKLWEEVYEIEQDLPHLLQSFSTYLTLNISTENIIDEVIDDYEKFGFAQHPVVKAFRRIKHTLLTTKESLMEIAERELPKLLPSKKVNQILTQIFSFSEISQASSAKVAKMVREQTIDIYKLDDYLKTMLAETVGLINITTTMLAPLLAAAAVVMSIAIVKSITYITQQLALIAASFGSTNFSISIVDTSKVVPPVFIEVIVGVFLVETILVMSLYSTMINTGNDRFKLFQAISSNMMGFVIYTLLLFGGYFLMVNLIFGGILGVK